MIAEWDAYDSNSIVPPSIGFLLLRYSQRSDALIKCTSKGEPFPKVVSSLEQFIIEWDNFTVERYYNMWIQSIMS